jgi:acyl carrier protein
VATDDADEVLRKVADVIAKTLRPPASTVIGAATTSADILGWDSLSHTIVIMNVEEAFDVELPFDEIAGLKNVGDLAALVRRLQAA